jgi:hypothetical protein
MVPISPHKSAALGLFRSSVFFVLAVAAFAERDAHTSTILLTMVFLLDVVSWHLTEVVLIGGNGIYNRVWFDTLADRFILEKLFNRIKYRENVDFSELVKEGTAASKEDVERYVRDNTLWGEWSTFKKVLAGMAYFIWFWISYGIFYGIAGFLGSAIQSSH